MNDLTATANKGLIGLQGKLVKLVPIQVDKHLDNYMRWFNDPEVLEHLGVEFPNTIGQEREFFEEKERSDRDVLFAIETLEGVHLGSSHIFGINFRHGFGHTGSFIGEASERGKGYGTESAILRARYAFHVLGLRNLYSAYFEGNTLSERMQEKAGYRTVGCNPKKIWKRGKYRDETLTALSREDFFAHFGNHL